MSHVVVTAVFEPKPGRTQDVLDALRVAIPLVHEEEGCELYAIHEAPDGTLVMIEKWTTAELLDAHGEGAPVIALRAAIAEHLERPVEVTRLMAIPLGDARRGAI